MFAADLLGHTSVTAIPSSDRVELRFSYAGQISHSVRQDFHDMVTWSKRGLLLAATASLLLASCGGSTSTRSRNGALTEGPPVVTPIGISPGTYLSIATAADGTVYVTEAMGGVTRISPEGVVEDNFVSTGPMPTGLAVDSSGNFYVSSETESTVMKFSPNGTEIYTENLDASPTAISVGPDGSVYWISANEGTVSRISPDGTNDSGWFVEAPNWFRERDEIFSAIDVDPSGNVAVADPNNGFVIVLSPDGTVKNRMEIRYQASDVKFAPNGDIYSMTEGGTVLTVMRTSGAFEQIRLQSLHTTGMAIDKSGIVYVSDYSTNSVLRVNPDISVDSWAMVGSGPWRIAAALDGTVYTVNQMSMDVSRIVPGAVGGGETPQENLKPALIPVFGSVTMTDGGFTVQVTNFEPAFDWNVAVDNQLGTASIDSSHGLVTLTGLVDGMSATVTVTSSRAGYEDGSASVVGSSLRPAYTPSLDTSVQTADGFTVQISNYDADWAWSVDVSNPGADVSIHHSGLIVVTGLPPATEATVTVTTTRNGYMDGVSQVNGASLAAGSDNSGEPAPEESTTTSVTAADPAPDESTTTSAKPAETSSDESTTTSVGAEQPTGETSTTTGPGSAADESTTSTEGGSMSRVSDAPMGHPAQVISVGKEEVAAIPIASISNAVTNSKTGNEDAPSAVLVSPGTDEIACTSVCVDSLFASLGVKSGVLTAYVGDADPVTIKKGSSAILKVGTKDTNVKFVLKAEDGKESTVDIPVVHSDAVSGPAGSTSGFSAWMLILLFAIIAMVMAFIYSLINRARSAGPISD